MSRPPKPTNSLKLSGSFREDRHGSRIDAEGLDVSTDIECPLHLDEDARMEWDRVVENLKRVGLATSFDRAVLATYCASWSRWVACERLLAEQPLVVDGHRGVGIVNPLTRLSRDSRDAMISSAKELGMTPSARSSIKIDAKRKDEDPLDALLAKRNA